MKPYYAADLFAGAGGSSTGLAQACESVGRRLRLQAVNHWPRSVETHSVNHPTAGHHCEDLTTMDPKRAVPGGKLDLLFASPSCVHHSVARGGVPSTEQGRASAWCVLRWATELTVDRIVVENVPEFRSWGPLDGDGKPIKSRKGETFQAFVNAIKSLGYAVEWQVLNAADFGGATTRRRLFIQAARGRRRIRWPGPSHAPDGAGRPRWRGAREIIDWTLPIGSIFARDRPLKPNTLKRIETGLVKFGGAAAEPFLVLLRGTSADAIGRSPRSLDDPAPTLTAGGGHLGLVEPFVLSTSHPGGRGSYVYPGDRPLPTVTTTSEHGLVEPFVVQTSHAGDDNCRVRPVAAPTFAATTRNNLGLVEPFIVPQMSSNAPRSTGLPVPTITTTSRGIGLCQPAGGPGAYDIRFRMLQPSELAAAMGFPSGYRFTGDKSEQTKQIGNAVEVNCARALCSAVLGGAS